MNVERVAKLSNGAELTVTLEGNWLTLTSHERNLLVILMNQVDSLDVKEAKEARWFPANPKAPGGVPLPPESTSESNARNEEGGTNPEY